jgi:hypothetical protein
VGAYRVARVASAEPLMAASAAVRTPVAAQPPVGTQAVATPGAANQSRRAASRTVPVDQPR